MDNHHVEISPARASCAILELNHISSDPQKVLYAVASYLYHPARGRPAAFVLWSDVVEGNGAVLAQACWQHNLGDMTNPAPVENPITSNYIKVWLCQINHEVFKKWYVDERVARAKRV